MHIKKGDTVQITTGKDAGKKGKVLKVIPRTNRVVVEGANRVKKHQRPTRALPQGGILKIESPLHASNVMLVCNKCHRPPGWEKPYSIMAKRSEYAKNAMRLWTKTPERRPAHKCPGYKICIKTILPRN